MFNHFVSLDDVLVAVCESDILVVEHVRTPVRATPADEATADSVYDDIARAMRSADIAPVIVVIGRHWFR